MEALNTYKAEKTLAEQMNERLAELKMTKAEAALKMNYSRSALSQYLNGKYGSDPTELEKKIVEFLEASGGIVEGRGQENIQAGAGILKKKVEFFESRDFVQTIGVCQACQQDMGLGIMLEERKGINNMYMQVVCSNSRYQRMDGRVQDINNAGIVTGLYGQAKESQSIGEVKSFPISEAKMLKLLPEGIEDYIKTLDDAKYVTIRKYIGKEDFYVTSANMMSPEGSDYAYAEDVRVSNRLVKAVRAAALDELQVEIDPGDIETSIANIQEQLATPVEDAVRDKIISSGTVAIDTENLNILVDESLDVRITYVPMGHVREMNLTFAVENPYAAS